MKDSMVISNTPDCFIELIHRRSSPTAWIVRRSKKNFLFKKRISSNWFVDAEQARSFAQKMKQDHERNGSSHGAEKDLRHA